MKELKKKVFNEINAIVNKFVEMAKDAEKSGAINYQPLLMQQSSSNTNINLAFDEAEERVKTPKKFW